MATHHQLLNNQREVAQRWPWHSNMFIHYPISMVPIFRIFFNIFWLSSWQTYVVRYAKWTNITLVAFISILSMKWVVVTQNLGSFVHIGIYGLPWVVAIKVKYLFYLMVMVWVFSSFSIENLISKKMIPHIIYLAMLEKVDISGWTRAI